MRLIFNFIDISSNGQSTFAITIGDQTFDLKQEVILNVGFKDIQITIPYKYYYLKKYSNHFEKTFHFWTNGACQELLIKNITLHTDQEEFPSLHNNIHLRRSPSFQIRSIFSFHSQLRCQHAKRILLIPIPFHHRSALIKTRI